MSREKIPLSKAFLWVLGSTLLISGTAFMGWLYVLHVKEQRFQDDQYRIVAIVQNNSQPDSLKTAYLAELLDLSHDHPVNLYQFDIKKGVKTLLTHSLIKEASIKKILPGTLLINYRLRTPVAYLGDFANTVVDSEGTLFPFRPFFTPKRLPILILGLEDRPLQWGHSIKEEYALKIAYSLLQQFEWLKQDRFWIKQLDVSHVQDDSYGKRQVVMILEDSADRHASSPAASEVYVRLNAEESAQALANFFELQEALFEKNGSEATKDPKVKAPVVFDFRLSHLAFIKGIEQPS